MKIKPHSRKNASPPPPRVALAPAPAAPVVRPTIAEHFERAILAAGSELRYLQVATDGLLTMPKLSYEVRRYEGIDADIREAVAKIGHTYMNGRKSLGEVLDLTINMHGPLPKAVFKIMRDLKESGGDTILHMPAPISPAEQKAWDDLAKEVAEQDQQRAKALTKELAECKTRGAAWNAFRERPENQGQLTPEMAEAFEKEWAARKQ